MSSRFDGDAIQSLNSDGSVLLYSRRAALLLEGSTANGEGAVAGNWDSNDTMAGAQSSPASVANVNRNLVSRFSPFRFAVQAGTKVSRVVLGAVCCQEFRDQKKLTRKI